MTWDRRTSGCRTSMMASSRERNRSSPWGRGGFGRIGCPPVGAQENGIMNRARVEDRSHTRAQNRKLLGGLALNPGENEYAQPAQNRCRTTAYTSGREVRLVG